jgi:hypothetical protein
MTGKRELSSIDFSLKYVRVIPGIHPLTGGGMRDDLLQQKALEIQDMLETWAVEKNILAPGERIVFSAPRIESVSTVVIEKGQLTEDLRKMPVMEFFTRERLLGVGTPPNFIGQILLRVKLVSHESVPVPGSKFRSRDVPFIHSMQEFLSEYPTEKDLRTIPYLGLKRVPYLMKVLEVFK